MRSEWETLNCTAIKLRTEQLNAARQSLKSANYAARNDSKTVLYDQPGRLARITTGTSDVFAARGD